MRSDAPRSLAPSVTEPESFPPDLIRGYPFGGRLFGGAFQSVTARAVPGA
jgi:hypothetical protein